jgi:uncharacterized protein YjdB
MRRFPLPVSLGATLVLLSLVYAGCTQGNKLTESAIVSSVTVAPKTITLTPGRTSQLTARAYDEGGSQMSASLQFQSGSTSIATVSSSGLVTAVGVGTTQITAEAGDMTDVATVTVNPAPVATVAVTPQAPTIVVNQTTQLTATTRDADGGILTGRTVTWETSAGGIASVTAAGLVRGVSPGTATITARSEGQSGTTSIIVQVAPVASVTLTPASPTIMVGATVQMVPVLRDATGAELSGRTVTYETSAGGIASVSASGLVTGVGVGSATITARSEGQTGTTVVTVQSTPPVPVATVTVGPVNPTVLVDGTVQLTATLRSSTGAVLTGRTITWETSASATATVGATTGLVRGVAAGTVTITARSEGQAGSTTVTVQLPPVASITVTPATPSILTGATTQLTATLRDAGGAVLTGRTVTWETSAGGTATVSGSGLVTGVAAGTATITARSEGQSGSTVVTVQAPPAPVATITLAPPTATINVNATQQLTPTLRDAQNNVLTGRTVTWETSAAGTATVSTSGLVRGVAAGTVTITARSEGQAGTATITVQLAPVATVTVTPASPSIIVGATSQLTATLRDAGGTVLTGRTVTWETSAGANATVSASGLVTGVAAGTATITARSEGQSGNTVVTVTAAPSANGIADPTLLPRATSQHPAAGTYGRNLAAGQTYIDPNTGVTVLKLTSASVPSNNGGMYHGYSEGGPNISQPWTGTDGQTYYTLKVGNWLVDLRYSTMTTLNWRQVDYDGEIGLAFSMNPATPRIAYIVQGKRVNRYNTATNAIENIGNWPWNISAAGTSPQWLQTQLNDTWLVGMLQSNFTIVAFRPSDGMQRSVTPAQANASIDEPHLDREFPVAYISGDSDPKNKMVNLETGVVTAPNDPNGWVQDAHQATMRGKTVAQGHWQANAIVATGVDGRVWKVASPTPTDVNGDYHFAGQWVFNNPNEYFTVDQFASTGNNAIYRGMIGFVSMAGDVRLLAATDAVGTNYESGGQPHPTLAQDGKLVMWVSNMNGSNRYDTFVARVPVR